MQNVFRYCRSLLQQCGTHLAFGAVLGSAASAQALAAASMTGSSSATATSSMSAGASGASASRLQHLHHHSHVHAQHSHCCTDDASTSVLDRRHRAVVPHLPQCPPALHAVPSAETGCRSATRSGSGIKSSRCASGNDTNNPNGKHAAARQRSTHYCIHWLTQSAVTHHARMSGIHKQHQRA